MAALVAAENVQKHFPVARSLDDLASRADMLTLHVPLVDATRGLIDAERIGLMPEGTVILNFSRGAIVNERAVLEGLERGRRGRPRC